RQQLFQDVHVQDYLGREQGDYLEDADDPLEQDVHHPQRRRKESRRPTRAWRQATCHEGRRTLCVYQHGGSLFTCNEAKRTIDSLWGLFGCEIRAKDGALLQEGFVDAPDCDYLVPSLAVDADGNVGLGCTRTSAKEYPSVYVMMHAASDPPNTMRPPFLAAKGTTVFSSNRESKYGLAWANYNSTCVDPSDPTTLWTYQEYSKSSAPSQWTTCWVAFKRK